MTTWTPWRQLFKYRDGLVIPRKVAGFWFHVTLPHPETGLTGFGIERAGLFFIKRSAWDGVFYVSLFHRKIVQTKPTVEH